MILQTIKPHNPTSSVHIVDYSPWPLYVCVSLLCIVLSSNLIAPVILLLGIVICWFRDIIREGFQGNHTLFVQKGLILGYLLFLITEIMLFFSFFWSYFHSSLSPNVELALIWPPLGIHAVNFLSLPLMGSTILLSSGFFVTLSHHSFLGGNKSVCLYAGLITVLLGISFVIAQATEYIYGTFTLTDSVFGTVFYMTTALHGIHVIIGVLFLIIQYFRIMADHLTLEQHLGFEFAIFYYHLVDVVWLFVFVVYYWWGS